MGQVCVGADLLVSMMDIVGVEGHMSPTILFQLCIILYIGLKWMMQHHYIGLKPCQWYHTHETIPYGTGVCMVGDTSHDGDT